MSQTLRSPLLATSLTYALGTFFYLFAFGLSPGQISVLVSSGLVAAVLSLFVSP